MQLVSIDRHTIDRHIRNLNVQQFLDSQQHILFETDTRIVQMHLDGCVTIRWLTRLATTILALLLSV